MVRLLTALVGTAAFLAMVFYLGDFWFFLCLLVCILGAANEFCRIVGYLAPRAPMRALLIMIPPTAYFLTFGSQLGEAPLLMGVVAVAGCIAVFAGCIVLFRRTPIEQALPAISILGFGTLYFAVPLAAMVLLRQLGWPVLLLTTAIVWVGDAVALYAGSAFGRHKLAPVVSPNKSWEGAIAAFVAGIGLAVGWSFWQLDRLEPGLLIVAAAVSVLAQVGDLVESMIKRGAKVKDSGSMLPGHGGWYDRLDALLFGAPMMLVGLWLIGFRP